MLKINPISKQILKANDKFEFEIQYDYTGNGKPYLAFSIQDESRNSTIYDSGQFQIKKGNTQFAKECH